MKCQIKRQYHQFCFMECLQIHPKYMLLLMQIKERLLQYPCVRYLGSTRTWCYRRTRSGRNWGLKGPEKSGTCCRKTVGWGYCVAGEFHYQNPMVFTYAEGGGCYKIVRHVSVEGDRTSDVVDRVCLQSCLAALPATRLCTSPLSLPVCPCHVSPSRYSTHDSFPLSLSAYNLRNCILFWRAVIAESLLVASP
jgi:hypothetical protein